MSRRKQSKPRQIKRSIGDLDGGEENTADDISLSGEEGGASDPEDSAECDSSSPPSFTPLYNEEPRTQRQEPPDPPPGGRASDAEDMEEEDEDAEEEEGPRHSAGREEEELQREEEVLHWRGPDDVALSEAGDDTRVVACRDLRPDTTWGPYPGIIQSDDSAEDQEPESWRLTLVCGDADCWLSRVTLNSDTAAANCTIYSKDEEVYCKVTSEIVAGDRLLASLSPPCGGSSSSAVDHMSPPLSLVTQKPSVKEESTVYSPGRLTEITLLPQQAGMAAILATAVVNKDIFPCKDCGIWYRSERNLQAHLMYYCASRQKQPAAASPPPQDNNKPKDSYPNERVCPFPQCNKSCPSASSLEIHMRTHSGERPFVCLICLSAFTTKANCERHLKVHTDTLNGVCHGCGFISTTRDILYSHLVTSHMVCQPGSRSEVYSPGPGLPKLPLAIGLSPGDTGVVLKCQVCGYNCDSPSQLQQHVRTHLEVRVPAERSPTPRQSTPSSTDHARLHPPPQDREPPACVPRPDSSSPGANGGSATPRGCSPPDPTTAYLRIKVEPDSDSELDGRATDMVEDGEEEEARGDGDRESLMKSSTGRAAAVSSQASTSPRSPSAIVVKAEPTSPTPGSSPAHVGGLGSVLPGGAVFLPQYMFSPEAAILPQASEILAKMSEMVHSRLKQDQAIPQTSPAAFYPAGASAAVVAVVAPHKGATCFECDITFNNINNFYVHKRLYCSSRHHPDMPAPASSGPGVIRDAVPAPPQPSSGGHCLSSSPKGGAASGAASRAASASPTDSDNAAGGRLTESRRLLAEVKMETPGTKEGVSSSSEGEGGGGSATGGGGGGGGGRASEGSQSPASGSAEDLEEDPTKTFCEACNIRFSRHENYTVHKRFYCASRHDPTNHRANHLAKASAAAAAAFTPQPFRTRKRKKMYEIHMARNEALAKAAAAAVGRAAPSPTNPGLTVKREVSPGAAGISSPEGDGPIDLSKRPRLQETPRGGGGGGGGGILPALPLTDYHKCTACSISFNSIENYLAHKTYYCPATTLQPHTLEQLHRLKRPASTSPTNRPDVLHPLEAKTLPADWVSHARGTSTPSPHPSALPGSEAASPQHTTTTTPTVTGAKGLGVVSPHVTCPYCPNRPIACDLVEHFKSVHGLILSVQLPHEAQQPLTGGKLSPSPSVSPRDGAQATTSTPPLSLPKPGSRLHRDIINGRVKREPASPSSPLMNGSPLGGGGGASPPTSSPLAVSPSRALSMTASPVPDALRETVVASLLPDKAALALASSHPLPVPRFCRLCNIKFSSLSTFIAHKKYYCSSHSAEHVK